MLRRLAVAVGFAFCISALVAAQPNQPTIGVPWLKEVQQAPDKLPCEATKLAPLLVDEQGRAIDSVEAWNKRRDEIRQRWLKWLGSESFQRQPIQLKVVSEDRVGKVLRQLGRYESEPGEVVEAYLMRPIEIVGKAAGVVVLHSTANQTIRQGAGLEGKNEEAWGLHLAERGMVTICPRCFLWRDGPPYDYNAMVRQVAERHPQSKGIAKMLFDAQRALDVLESLDYVDQARLGAAGHSLGAKEALYLAAFDERVKAAVSSEGGIGLRFSNWNAPWYLSDEIDKPDFVLEQHELLALVAPRAFLLMGGNSADGAQSWPFIAAALPVYQLYPQPSAIGLFNHGKGHTIPPLAEGRTYEWLEAYLARPMP